MKLDGVLKYHIGMCILSGLYVRTQNIKLTVHAMDSSVFQQILLNEFYMYDCNETQWSDRLHYCSVHFIRNLSLQ